MQSKYTRGPWFDALRLDPHNANLITERQRQKHDALRAKMAPGVSIVLLMHMPLRGVSPS